MAKAICLVTFARSFPAIADSNGLDQITAHSRVGLVPLGVTDMELIEAPAVVITDIKAGVYSSFLWLEDV